jgi:PAS domain S-box-containing protein
MADDPNRNTSTLERDSGDEERTANGLRRGERATRERHDHVAQRGDADRRALRQETRRTSRHPALVWLPLPLLIIAAATIYLTGPHIVAESEVLLATLNTLFVGATGLLLAFLAANTYLATGGRGLLALACAALTMGIVYILAAPLLGVSVDALLVLHNVGALGASVLFILSAVWIVHEGSPQAPRSRRRAYAVLSLSAVLIALAVLTLVAFWDATPAFFLPESGTVTPLRQAVLGSAVGGFIVAALLACLAWRKTRSAFLKWYSLGLAMLAVGLGTVWLGEPGSLISWLGRGTQYAGGIYLLVAIIMAILDSGRWRIVLSRPLRELEGRYANLVAMSPNAVIVQAEGLCVFANPSAAVLLGASSPEELVGSRVADFFPSGQRESLGRRVHEALRGVPFPVEESFVTRTDGILVPVDVTGGRVEYEERAAVQLIIRDITARKAAEDLLRDHEAERVTQEERTRIARDLHDSVTQSLFAATLKAEALAITADGLAPGTNAALEEVHRLNRGSLAQMRTLLLELHGQPIAEVPLQQLLRHLVEAAESRANVNVTLSLDEQAALSPKVHEAVYRITQEALNNVVRHAKAQNATVQLHAEDGNVSLVVRDDGRGFDQASVNPGHFGLAVMRDRAKESGGEVTITSKTGEGTVVRADWQLGR